MPNERLMLLMSGSSAALRAPPDDFKGTPGHQHRPDYVAVAFDLQGPTFRHEQYAEYKATRQRMPDDLRDQFPKVREVVKALRIPVYELPGYEADDVIGTLTVEAEARASRRRSSPATSTCSSS